MHRSKEVLNQYAKLAAEGYLTQKTSLNDSLTKVAKDESLEPHQVEYVASQTNHAVWERLYALNKKASYDFPIADANAVINKLQIQPSKGVIKQASLDYMSAPSRESNGFVEKTAYVNLDSLDKSDASRRSLKAELVQRFEKVSTVKEDFEMKMYALGAKFDEGIKTFVKEARTMIMDKPFEHRGIAMDKIGEFVKAACEEDTSLGKMIMMKLSAVLAGQGLIKKADLKAPEEYISQNMPAQIVNGRHALYITIKTLKDIRQTYDPLHRGYEICDSSLPVLKEKIRAL